MAKVRQVLHRAIRDESGQSLLEYGLIAALVAVLAIGALVALNGGIGSVFGRVTNCLNSAAGGTSC